MDAQISNSAAGSDRLTDASSALGRIVILGDHAPCRNANAARRGKDRISEGSLESPAYGARRLRDHRADAIAAGGGQHSDTAASRIPHDRETLRIDARCCVARHLFDRSKHVAGFSRVERGTQAGDAVTVVTELRESLTFRVPGSATFGKQHGIPCLGEKASDDRTPACRGIGAAMSVDDERKWATPVGL
jgi:hypothetical protein